MNGRVELKDANVNYTDAPNGLSNGNGVILLNGTNATYPKLYGRKRRRKDLGYRFRRVRSHRHGLQSAGECSQGAHPLCRRKPYIECHIPGGHHTRSTLNGSVTIQRIAYSTNSDAGSILSTAVSAAILSRRPIPASDRYASRSPDSDCARLKRSYHLCAEDFAHLKPFCSRNCPGSRHGRPP